MRIRDVTLPDRPLLLAPMEDVTDASFRKLCKRYGADMVYTEFVNADGLTRGAAGSLAKIAIDPEERPIGIQIYGQNLDTMLEAARMVDAVEPDVIDLNFGCPVKKIAGRGAGAGMLCNIPLMLEMVRAIVDTVHRPVTVKTRLGWDAESIIIESLAEQLQDAGIAALTIHGRTRAQMYKGSADWGPIGRVKANPRLHIPIIGNGDIATPEAAAEAFDRYAVDGVMVGRASFGKPWIFREIRTYLETGRHPEPAGIEERVAIAREHLALSLAAKGAPRGILELRRHLACYFKGLPHFKPMRLRLLTELDPAALDDLLGAIEQHYRGWVPEGDDVTSPWLDAAQ